MRIAAQKLWLAIDGVDDHVDIAVVIEVAEGAASRGAGRGNSGASIQRDIFEMPVALIAIQQLSLGVAGFGAQLFDLGINMAIANQDVRPAVIIEVEKTTAPSKILRVHA